MQYFENVANSIMEQALKAYKKAAHRMLEEQFIPAFLSRFEQEYRKEFGSLSSRMEKQGDPTAPMLLFQDVRSFVEAQLRQSIVETDKGISFSLDLTGFGWPDNRPDRKETDRVRLFFFYLEGMIGKFVFINNETYHKLRSGSHGGLGRFGEGFLINYDDYYKWYLTITANNKQADVPHPNDIMTPFSGRPPSMLFDVMASWAQINVVKFLEQLQVELEGGAF